MQDRNYRILKFKAKVFTRNYNYIIADHNSGKSAFIDPSWQLQSHMDLINENNLKPEFVLLTHSHFDHVNLADRMVQKYGCTVYMSKREIDYYRFRCKNLCALEDGDVLSLGGNKINCLLTPGHTAGSMCFLFEHDLFSGDTVFIEGCGLCQIPGGCPSMMYDSIQRIKAVVPLEAKVYPGHSYGLEPGHPLQFLCDNNVYFMFQNADDFVRFRMRKKQHRLFDFK